MFYILHLPLVVYKGEMGAYPIISFKILFVTLCHCPDSMNTETWSSMWLLLLVSRELLAHTCRLMLSMAQRERRAPSDPYLLGCHVNRTLTSPVSAKHFVHYICEQGSMQKRYFIYLKTEMSWTQVALIALLDIQCIHCSIVLQCACWAPMIDCTFSYF